MSWAALAVNTNQLGYSTKVQSMDFLESGKEGKKKKEGREGGRQAGREARREQRGREEIEPDFSVATVSLEGTCACLLATGSVHPLMSPAKTLYRLSGFVTCVLHCTFGILFENFLLFLLEKGFRHGASTKC